MKVNKAIFIFYILVGYIFIQFSWWGFHLIELNKEVYQLKTVITESQGDQLGLQELAEKLNVRKTMVIGEGLVFLVLLALGAFTTRRAFLREVDLSNQQKNFLMSVSHELKSPLASIKLNLQTLVKHDLDAAKSESLLKASVKDTDRLVALVDNVMIATGIESGDFPLKKEKLNMSNVVSDTLASITAWSKKEIDSDIEANLHVLGDEQAMISITSNLVINAIKYSGEGDSISVLLKSEGESVCLSVIDQGVGIALEDQQRIFNKFYRAGNESTRKTKGAGLGLFISRHLTEKQNGEISVRRNDTKGSTFEVRFKVT